MAAFSGAWWEAEGLRVARLGPPGVGGDFCCGGGMAGDRRDAALRELALSGRGGRYRPGFFPRALLGNLRQAAFSSPILSWALPPPAKSRTCCLRSRSPASSLFDVAVTENLFLPRDTSGPGQAKKQVAWGWDILREKDDCPVWGRGGSPLHTQAFPRVKLPRINLIVIC